MSRRSTTLVDDSLLAGAFLCYVTWALAGWRWLVPPAILFIGYAWFSPRTAENSRRIHSVDAVLAIWIVAIAWLTLSRTLDRPALIYPFTLVFACAHGHLRLEPPRPSRDSLTRSARSRRRRVRPRVGAHLRPVRHHAGRELLVNLSLTVRRRRLHRAVASRCSPRGARHAQRRAESRALDATGGERRRRVGRRLGRTWRRSSAGADA